MKQFFTALLIALSFFQVSAHAGTITIVTKEEQARLEREVTRGEALSYFASYYKDSIPDTYKYIDLKFTDVLKGSKLYSDIQVLVYLDLVTNTSSQLHPNKKINLYTFSKLSEKILGFSLTGSLDTATLKSQNTTQEDFESLEEVIEDSYSDVEVGSDFSGVNNQVEIFQDVYKTLLEMHYDKEDLDTQQMMYGAIEGLVEGADDTYTTYFPPTESRSFQENINGEYEGIGAYVEMTDPGKVIIVTPIVDGPAEKAGIKGGDRITHVDGEEITPEVGLQEAIVWIKGPKGTSVTLTVQRGEQVLEIEVIRDKIVIQDIEHSLVRYDTFYIQIKNFGPNVFEEFEKTLEALEQETRVKKVIIDVRNNPGGYLDQVSKILSHFVPVGEPTAIVDYGTRDQVYKSMGYQKIDWSDYELVLLQNSGSASASEILVGTLKDYYPKATIIGEKSFGKGSVQNIKSYSDGSTLKITVAKWFTGKSRTGIDGIGISADIELELDIEKFEKGTDNQLQEAIKQ